MKKEYEEFVQSSNDGVAEPVVETDIPKPKEEVKEYNVAPNAYGFGDYNQKDEFLETLAAIAPENFKVLEINAPDEENAVEPKSVDYYYPKKMDDPTSKVDAETIDEAISDHEMELLHTFFPTNGVSDAIDDAKNFLISHKFVTDENEIEVVRGPFAQYEIEVMENEEFGDTYETPDIVYVKEIPDEEINEIADLIPPKPDYPENANEQQRAQQQRQQPNQQAREEVKRKPEDRLPYEKPSRELPCLLYTNTKSTISIDQLVKDRYSTSSINEERKARKRMRSDSLEDTKVFADIPEKSEEAAQARMRPKHLKIDDSDLQLIEVIEDDTETRKKSFKTYCEYKNRYETIKKRANPEEMEEIKKFSFRLNKGLLISCNRNSIFRRICELYLKDRCTYLEKRR